MTEEIIIDGVNVAGCEHYCEKLNTGSGIIQNTSKQGFCLHNITGLQNADIYFRVLSFPKCREQSNCYYKQLKRLEVEHNTICYNLGLLEKENERIYNDGQTEITRLCNENNNLKSALEEIREMCKRQDFNQGMRTFEILKVINGVLNHSEG